MHSLLKPNVRDAVAPDVVIIDNAEGQARVHLLDVLRGHLDGVAGSERLHVMLRGLGFLGAGVVGHHGEAEGVQVGYATGGEARVPLGWVGVGEGRGAEDG